MSEITVTRGEQVTVGRRDYGWGVPGTLVDVGGEPFVDVGGTLYVTCGDCDLGYSGSKRHFAHVLGAVCFGCNGQGVTKALGSEADAVKIVKRRQSDRARRDRKRGEAEVAKAAARASWVEANPEAWDAAVEVLADAPQGNQQSHETTAAWEARWGGFVTGLAQTAQYQALSEKQTAALVKAFTDAKVAIAAEAEAASKRRYYGSEGDKVAVTGTVAVATTVEHESYSGFGTDASMLVIVEGSGEFEGVTVKAFGKGKTLWETERGAEVVISGTIKGDGKGHVEYDGTPQTVLTRAKVAAAPQVAAVH